MCVGPLNQNSDHCLERGVVSSIPIRVVAWLPRVRQGVNDDLALLSTRDVRRALDTST